MKEKKKEAVQEIKDEVKEYAAARLRMRLEDLAVRTILLRLKKPAPSTKNIFTEIDDVATALFGIELPNIVIRWNKDAYSSVDFSDYDSKGDKVGGFEAGWTREGTYDWKKGFIPATIEEVTNDVTLKRIIPDAFYGTSPLLDFGIEATTSESLFPIKDSTVCFKSKKEVDDLIKDTKLNGRNEEPPGASPDPYEEHVWGDKTSDLNFSRFFFHAMGASILERQFKESSEPDLGPIEIDMDFMKDLPVRKGFRPMGVKLYFGADQQVTGIYDSAKKTMYKPGDRGWEGATYLARASAVTLLTARDHLFQTHLLVSNYFSLASIKHLPPSHPIRRLVNVFTFRTNRVNNDAFSSLIRERGVLHRATGFEYEGLLNIFDYSFKN